MRPFQFAPEPVLRWRSLQLASAEKKFAMLIAEQQRLEADLRSVEASVRSAARSHLDTPELMGSDLRRVATYLLGLERQRVELRAALQRTAAAVRTQQRECLEATKRVELLKALKKARRDDWRREGEREMETLGTESYLARLIRERK